MVYVTKRCIFSCCFVTKKCIFVLLSIFLITTCDGIIPVEVKSSDNFRAKSLKVYMQKFSPKYAIRLSTRNFGMDNGIKSVSLYATFCIKDSSF